ncbi:MAG: biotin/lipoyl-containing protein, partial [Tepidiformaceae bacterium]
EVLRGMGDKAAARQLAVENGVPVVPGWDGADDDATLVREAARIGFPVMLKARGGGGGRGMREVFIAEQLPEAIESARREALAAFGDGGLLLEKLVTNAHHVEVQVLADTHGNVIHLGERDCSVQRRHQKLIEETPSPVVDDALREQLTGHALKLARAIGYVNAGTFEFLVTPETATADPRAYFLEVNPRLQVEHPVTEMVTGLDLVELQLRVAAGEPLPLRQEEVQFEGHAIEFRVNAEDPWDGFKPSSGRIEVLWGEDATRYDAGFAEGDVVPGQYDSLIGKRIFHQPTREEAVASAWVIGADDVFGIRTNLGLLKAIARSTEFGAGRATIDWLERNLPELLESGSRAANEWAAAACGFVVAEANGPAQWIGAGTVSLWLDDGIETRQVEIALEAGAGGTKIGNAWVGPGREQVSFRAGRREGVLVVSGAGWSLEPSIEVTRGHPTAYLNGDIYLVAPPPLPRHVRAVAEGATAITAPLSGTIAAVRVAEGDAVVAGQLLLVLEAMKMEHRITAPTDATVKSVNVSERDTAREGDVLVELG